LADGIHRCHTDDSAYPGNSRKKLERKDLEAIEQQAYNAIPNDILKPYLKKFLPQIDKI